MLNLLFEYYEYNFKYGFLMDICRTNYNMKGVESENKYYMKFLYNDDNLLQKLQNIDERRRLFCIRSGLCVAVE